MDKSFNISIFKRINQNFFFSSSHKQKVTFIINFSSNLSFYIFSNETTHNCGPLFLWLSSKMIKHIILMDLLLIRILLTCVCCFTFTLYSFRLNFNTHIRWIFILFGWWLLKTSWKDFFQFFNFNLILKKLKERKKHLKTFYQYWSINIFMMLIL